MKSSKENKQYGIGVDIGGTKISIVLGTRGGRILEKVIMPTPHGRQSRNAFKLIRNEVNGLLRKRSIRTNQIKGVGIGVPGLFNYKTGIVEESPNLRDWVGLNLIKIAGKVFPGTLRIENDANATAIAEKLYGLGKGLQTFVYMTISTGIGSGIIIDGRLHRGISDCAGEVGQSVVDPSGWRNHLGVPGTLEGEASGKAIARKAEKVYSKSKTLTKMKKKDGILKSQHIKEAAVKGDKVSIGILKDAAKKLGIGLSNIIMVLNPERIILGGGVLKGKGGEKYFRLAKETAQRYTWPRPYKYCSIIKTKSLDNIADLGALSLVFEE